MAINQGTIFTPNKKKTLIDEIQQEMANLDVAIRDVSTKKSLVLKLNTIRATLQQSLTLLYDKKGVVTPQETDRILSQINDSKRSRLESDYYMGMSKTTFYLVAFAALAFGVYFYTKNRG
jgi:hypothetical protein